ncbi:hypothetical protein [Neolewinella antarctica]|uniref:Uncharacterized protein n=1 Tax=Neolewinella antarctica TaxID=442734 RepID=A0ABX0XHF7_9BACT|nr:hypothetical protein [Neolewinella antarctica]NJC28187.1 hypothetical protein [Neolewinella antarctica]
MGNDQCPSFQIDLIINRADNAINLCEFKHSQHPVRLSDAQLDQIAQRRDAFVAYSRTGKMVLSTLVVAPELGRVDNVAGVVQGVVGLGDLFG